jgi:ABC-type bacteriocin/lantibiotic exporter with double-glycine peptidase domain
MTNPLDHPWAIAAVLVLTALPLLLLTLGAVVVAIVSTCSRSPARREHSRKLLRELTSLAKVLRTG